MKAQAMVMPKKYFFDKDGNPLAFGKVYTYQTQTVIDKETFTTENGDVANTNPVILNGEGYASIYLEGSYSIVVDDQEDNNIWSEDPVSSNIANEWINCLAATYVSPTSFKVNGNATSTYEEGRRVRIDNGIATFSYSSVKSTSFAAGETTITVTDAVVAVGIVEVCLSVVGLNSSPRLEINDVAEMKTRPLKSGQLAETLGYWVAGDGGGAKYLIVDPQSFDGYGDHQLVNGNIAVLQVEGAGNLRQYGAKFDGVTDDSNSITAAEAANSNNEIEGDRLSPDEYATFGGNVVIGPTSLVHSPGSEETLNAGINLQPDTYYRITIAIQTTHSGFVKFLFGNDTIPANQQEIIFGDQTNGFYFSTETILLDGTENNRIMVDNVYYYSLYTSGSSYSNLQIVTDIDWGGNVSSVTIQEVNEKPAFYKGIPSDGYNRDYYTGIKGGSVNRNDLAVGDKSALGMFIYDGLSPTPAHNVALGSKSLSALQHGDENTALGTFALQGNEGSNNTAVGYSALKICNKGQENTSMGYKSGTFVTTGYKNTFLGFWAGAGIRTGRENVDIGWRPNQEPSDKSFGVAVGSQAGLGVNIGNSNTFIGRNSGRNVSGVPTLNLSSVVSVGADSAPWGNNSVCVGFQSKVGIEVTFADYAISIGDNATTFDEDSIAIGHVAVANGIGSISIGEGSLTSNNNCTAVGSDSVAGADEAVALGKSANATASRSVAVGGGSLASTQSVAVGSLSTPAGANNTAVGFRAGNNFNGSANTFLGHTAGLQAVETFSNCTLLGSLTVVTGSNQVQLGDSATTTHCFFHGNRMEAISNESPRALY